MSKKNSKPPAGDNSKTASVAAMPAACIKLLSSKEASKYKKISLRGFVVGDYKLNFKDRDLQDPVAVGMSMGIHDMDDCPWQESYGDFIPLASLASDEDDEPGAFLVLDIKTAGNPVLLFDQEDWTLYHLSPSFAHFLSALPTATTDTKLSFRPWDKKSRRPSAYPAVASTTPKPAAGGKRSCVIWHSLRTAGSVAKIADVDYRGLLAQGAKLDANFFRKLKFQYSPGNKETDNIRNFNCFTIISAPLKSFLEGKNIPGVQFFPVVLAPLKSDYYIVFVNEPTDCLDLKKLDYDKFVLKPDKIPGDRAIFRAKGYYWHILADKALADELTKNKFTGFDWVPPEEYSQI